MGDHHLDRLALVGKILLDTRVLELRKEVEVFNSYMN